MNRIKWLESWLFAGAVLLSAVMVLGAARWAHAEPDAAWKPKWNKQGELVLPSDYRLWVFLGAPLTPHALNDGKAGFPEFHNVYVHPAVYEIYQKTGEFPEGTILVKELQLTLPGTFKDGSRIEASGRGFFPSTLNGIDISVKDSARFKTTRGWGFFNFGHHAPPYAKTAAVMPVEACAGCHMANTKTMVFEKFYEPILNTKNK